MEQNDWLENAVNESIIGKSISSLLSVDIKDVVPEGENYGSIISQATLNVILKTGKKSKLYLILKKQHTKEDVLKSVEDFPAFKNEITIYKHIFEKCEQLMDEYGDFNDKLWCNLIAYKPYNLIVLEDLKVQNFHVADRLKMLDLNHTKLVLHSLGRLHGISHVLIKRGNLKKTDLSPSFVETDSPVVQNLFKGALLKLALVIEKYWSNEWKPIADIIKKEADVAVDKIRDLVKSSGNAFLTLNHGDCWTCNFMFKYSPYDDNMPIAMKFVDLQLTNVNTFIFDINHLLYTSTVPNVRRKHFNELLEIYQKSLATTLAIYGMENDTPSLEQVHSEAKRVEYLGHIATMVFQPITMAVIKNGFNVKYLSRGENGMDAFHEDLFNTGICKTNIQEELKHWLGDAVK